MSIVVDCSIAVAWAFHDENSDIANEAMKCVRRDGGHAPALWWWELSNAVLVATKRKRCTLEEASLLLRNAVWGCVNLHSPPDVLGMEHTVRLAQAYSLTIYDAAYLDLAIRLQYPLATLDKQLVRAAREAGVPLFSVNA